MCKAIEDMKRDERREGRYEGRREGRKSGELTMALKSVKNLMKNQKITFEEAVAFLEIPKRISARERTSPVRAVPPLLFVARFPALKTQSLFVRQRKVLLWKIKQKRRTIKWNSSIYFIYFLQAYS